MKIRYHENLSWKKRLKLTENKIAENIGIIYKVKSI